MNLEELLDTLNIRTDLLMPRLDPDSNPVQLNCDPDDPAPFPAYLPLEIFDNAEYDCRLPTEWLDMGWVVAEHARWPVPGLALLPSDDDLQSCTYTLVVGDCIGARLYVSDVRPPGFCNRRSQCIFWDYEFRGCP